MSFLLLKSPGISRGASPTLRGWWSFSISVHFLTDFAFPSILFIFALTLGTLSGKEECIVENNDVVLFLSTLHGG